MKRIAVCAALSIVAGCGGGGKGRDHGAPSTVYPAPHSPAGQVQNGGGPIVASPLVTSITFPGDPLAPLLDDFTERIGASSYWDLTTSQYGIAPAVATTAVHYAIAAPPTTSGAATETWLASMLDGSHPEFPAPIANRSLYVIYYPEGTVVDDGPGDVSCTDYFAYHYFINVSGVDVAYALVPRCAGYLDISELDLATDSASHEMVEAVSDPYLAPGWLDTDPDGAAFDLSSDGGELADMCQYEQYNNFVPSDLPYVSQRSWSNSAAAAGNDPCQPDLGGPYFSAAAVVSDTFNVTDSASVVHSAHGVSIPLGKSRTIELDLFSDAATGPIFVTTEDNALTYGLPAELSATVDRDHGVNGEKVYVTIHVIRRGTTLFDGAEVLDVFTTSNGIVHNWPIVVKS